MYNHLVTDFDNYIMGARVFEEAHNEVFGSISSLFSVVCVLSNQLRKSVCMCVQVCASVFYFFSVFILS